MNAAPTLASPERRSSAEPVRPNRGISWTEPAFVPRFRGFLTADGRRHPKRFSQILRSLDSAIPRTARPQSDYSLHPTVARAASPLDGTPQLSPGSMVDIDHYTPRAADRRRFLRRLSRHLVRILPFREFEVDREDLEWALHESPIRGQMADISMNGVAFRLKEPLTSSTRVWLKLESRARDFAVVRAGRIIRVTPHSATEWTVICRFDHCVPYADVVQLSQ